MTTTITDRVMLVKVDNGENNNKFYEVSLDSSGVVSKRWGRVGATGQSSTEHTGQAGFNKTVASKKKRGYKEVNLVDAPKTRQVNDLVAVSQKRIPTDPGDALLKNLIKNWCAANRHNIETSSGGLITVSDSGVVSTALGVVSANTIAEARTLLDLIAKARKLPITKIEDFLTLIPQDIGRQRDWAEAFVKPENVQRQRDFLDSLDGSLAVAASVNADDEDEVEAEFRYTLTTLDKTDPAFIEMNKRFLDTKNQQHTSSRLKLQNVFQVLHSDPVDDTTWKDRADTHGNVKRLWHGTGSHNLISIFHRGLYVPPTSGSTVQVTGRMFGDGVYFSDQSTKSLNYSQGYWSGTRANECFMLMADVVMGREFRPSQYGAHAISQSRNGQYHSINVRGGTAGVRNNEMIVWDTTQIRISYLCQFS